jgi:DNA-binding MarR family transcriptional regulator
MEEVTVGAVHPSGHDNREDLVVLLIRTATVLVERLRAQRPAGDASPLTVVHGLAANYLVGHRDVTSSDLARYLKITKQSASEVVAVLETAGIVRRAPHPTDRRARVLLLTDAGRTKLDDGRRQWQDLEDEWATLVGRDRLGILREVLESYLTAEEANTRAPCRDVQQIRATDGNANVAK